MLYPLLITTLLSAPASNYAQTKILFLGAKAQSGIDEGTAVSISELVLAELDRHADVSGETDITTLLNTEAKALMAGCDVQSCLAEIGSALGTTYVVEGTVGMIGEQAVLTLKLINTQTVKIVARAHATANTVEGLIGAESSVVALLLGLRTSTPFNIGVPAAMGLAAMATGTALGVGFGLRARNLSKSAVLRDTPSAEQLRAYNQKSVAVRSSTLVADVGFAVAALGLITFVVDFFFLDNPLRQTTAVELSVEARSATLLLRF